MGAEFLLLWGDCGKKERNSYSHLRIWLDFWRDLEVLKLKH